MMHGKRAVVITADRATELLRIFPGARWWLNVVSHTHRRNTISEQYTDSVEWVDDSKKLIGKGEERSHGD